MDILQDIPSFIDYFRQLSVKSKELRGFANGSAERIISLQDELEYPCLWLEMPTLVPDENEAEHITGTWTSAILVLQSTSDFTYAQEDQAWAATLKNLRSVLSRLKVEHRGFSLSKKPIEPINPMFASQMIGWRVEIEMDFSLDLEFEENEWEEEA